MPTFRSNSSASTTMTVTLTEIARDGNNVTMRVNWSVSLGGATSLGPDTVNNRTLYIYRSNGTLLGSSTIKSSQYWYANQTYSGSFNITFNVGETQAGDIDVYIQTNSSGTQSCIWTNRDYCYNFPVAYSLYWTVAGAPSKPTFSAFTFETNVALQWTAATPGVNNAITGYIVRYRYNNADPEYTQNVGPGVTSWALGEDRVDAMARGTLVDFYITATAERGPDRNSGRSVDARKNRLPARPTSPSVAKTSYVPGEEIWISFSNNGDPDDNLAGFEVATNINTTVVGTRVGSGITMVGVDTTGWSHGVKRKFRVRGYDALGARGPWSVYTAEVTLNTAPLAPQVNYPAAGSTIYNKRPRMLLTAGATNDGPKHILSVNDGDGDWTTAVNYSLFSCGQDDDLAGGRKVVFRRGAGIQYPVGSRTIKARMYDSFLYSAEASNTFTVAEFAPTDPTIETAGMKIKAVHVTQLQAAINNIRVAYGYAAYAFTTVTAGVTPIGDAAIITQMQTALQAVIDRINDWDTTATFDISVTWINPAATGGGVDRVKLRQAIEQLRTMVREV